MAKWAPYTDKRLTSQIELKTKEVGEIVAQGEFIGTAAELKKLLRPLRNTGLPTSIWIKEVPYSKAIEFLIYQAVISLRIEKIRVILERPFPYKAIQRMKEFLAHAPNSNTTIWQSLRSSR